MLPLNFDNRMEGRTYGLEVAANWQALPDWRLHGSYSWLTMDLKAKPGGSGIVGFGAQGQSPRHMVKMHSLHKLRHDLELDASLAYTSPLSFKQTAGTATVPSHTRVDLRLGWRPSAQMEINLIGRNLLKQRHAEYLGEDVTASQVPRSLLLQGKWKF